MRKGMVMKQPFEKLVEQHGGTVDDARPR